MSPHSLNGESPEDASLRLTNGKGKTLVRNRMKRGWDKDRAFTTPPMAPGGQCQAFDYKGETYKEASLRLTAGKSTTLVYERIKRGWTNERAFNEPHDTKRANYKTNRLYP